jgi:hypothetical protein
MHDASDCASAAGSSLEPVALRVLSPIETVEILHSRKGVGMGISTTRPALLSPDAALAWEFWNRYRRQLPMILLVTALIPVNCAIYQWIVAYHQWRMFRIWEPFQELSPRVHMAVALLILATVPLVLLSLAPVARHSLLPVDTRKLAWFRWLHGAMGAALQTAGACALARTVTQNDWPIVELTIDAVLVFAVAQWIAVQFRKRERWIAGAGCVATGGLIRLFMIHWHQPGTALGVFHSFVPHTPTELACVAASVGILCRLTLRAAEHDRCRDQAFEGWFVREAVAHEPMARRSYRTQFGSLLAWEWQRSGWLYPVGVVVGTMAVYLVSGYLHYHEYGKVRAESLFQVRWSDLIVFGMIILILGPCLLIFVTPTGRRVLAGKGSETWPLTLPLSNRQIGYAAVLRAGLSSLAAALAGGGIALAFVLGTYLMLRMRGESGEAEILWTTLKQSSLSRLHVAFALTFVSWFTMNGLFQSAILTGRRLVAGLPHLFLIGLWLTLVLWSLIAPGGRVPDGMVPFGIALVSGLAVLTAYQVGEIRWPGLLACAVLWLGTTELFDVLSLADRLGHWPERGQWVFFHSEEVGQIFLVCSCMMLPVALPPLAVRWNRSR